MGPRARPVLGRLLLYGGGLFVVLPFLLSCVMVLARPRWQADGGASAAGFEDVRFSSGALRLHGALVRGRRDRAAVIVVPGLGDSAASPRHRETAAVLGRRGHTVLLLDLRAHGASEGRYTTLGGHERDDVRAAAAFLDDVGLAVHGVVLMGCSMGAVAALRAAADTPAVRAVVAEAPYDTYRDTIAHHARLALGPPWWAPLLPITVAFAEWQAAFDADDVDAVAAARHIRAPLLAIVDERDDRMPEAVVRRVYAAHPGPKRLWIAAGARHGGAPGAPGYWAELLGFLDRAGV
jgi:pimeloyl-ACP methyl ester carboxylesterase